MHYSLATSRKAKIIAGSIVGGLAWGVALLLYFGNLLESYELKTYDQLCRWKASRSPAPEEVVVVALDQGSLEAAQREGIQWPWPRQMYAPILQFCALAGAKAVAFDVLYTEPSSYGVEDDRILAEAMKENGKAILPVFLSREKRPGKPWEKEILNRISIPLDPLPGESPNAYVSLIPPIEPLAEVSRKLGNVAVFPDFDGIYRRIPVMFPYQNRWIPSLGLAVYDSLNEKGGPIERKGQNLYYKGLSIPLDGQGRFLLHYYGGEGDFRRFSAFNVIQSFLALQEGKKPIYSPETFRDKIVFIGFTAAGLYDLKPTPVSSVSPGVAVHATLVANLLRGDFLQRIPRAALLLLGLILALVLGSLVMVVSGLWVLTFLALAFGGALLVSILICFQYRLWVDGIFLAASLGLSFAMSTTFSYATEGRQRRQIKQIFSHYMSEVLIQDLLKHPEKLRLGGERRVLTVFFSDLAGFTSISEKLSPEEVVALLNRYLTEMSDIILESGGIIDKFEGDAIMAFWGAPIPQEDHAIRACFAALDNQRRLVTLREEFSRQGLPPIYARIGINTGPMIIGNMGSGQRFDFTVIGDSVNLASRLEGAGKEYGVSITISEDTYAQAREQVEVRELDLLQVKGKERPVRIYELLARKGMLDEKKKKICDLFGEGLAHYRKQAWDEAISCFGRSLELDGNDGPAQTFLRRCQYFKAHPPGPEWDGVYRLTSK